MCSNVSEMGVDQDFYDMISEPDTSYTKGRMLFKCIVQLDLKV
eukprot:gene15977-18154_t